MPVVIEKLLRFIWSHARKTIQVLSFDIVGTPIAEPYQSGSRTAGPMIVHINCSDHGSSTRYVACTSGGSCMKYPNITCELRSE
jgi:hypothetical protein